MPKTVVYGNQVVDYVFNKTAIPWAANTNFYVSLHTLTPTVAGDQSTNEVDYVGYERVAVVRTSSGFTITANQSANTSDIEFPQVEEEPPAPLSVTHFGIGTDATGTGTLLYFTEITDGPIEIDISLIPRVLATDLTILEE